MQSNSTVRALAVAVAMLVISGCSANNTSIEQSWTAHAPRAQLQRVVTMFGARDGVLRRTMENRMAQRLAALGVKASPAYQILTDADRMVRERAIAKLRDGGYDGVIVVRLVGEPGTAPENFDTSQEMTWPYDDGDLGTMTAVVRMETNAYSLRNNQLIWSALTKTLDPDNLTDLINEVSRIVVRELVRRSVFAES